MTKRYFHSGFVFLSPVFFFYFLICVDAAKWLPHLCALGMMAFQWLFGALYKRQSSSSSQDVAFVLFLPWFICKYFRFFGSAFVDVFTRPLSASQGLLSACVKSIVLILAYFCNDLLQTATPSTVSLSVCLDVHQLSSLVSSALRRFRVLHTTLYSGTPGERLPSKSTNDSLKK